MSVKFQSLYSQQSQNTALHRFNIKTRGIKAKKLVTWTGCDVMLRGECMWEELIVIIVQ